MFSNKRVLKDPFLAALRAATPARIGIGHSGGRYPTEAQLAFQADLAAARDAVRRDADEALIKKLGLLVLTTQATSRAEYLRNTGLGRRLDGHSEEVLKKSGTLAPDIQLIASDGLSAEAFEHNVPQTLPLLAARLGDAGVRLGTPLYVRRARVAVIDHIGEILRPKAALILLGERPGLGISDSLSGYFEFEPGPGRIEADRNVLSNIHERGVPPVEAALMLAEALLEVLAKKQSGMNVRFDFR